MPSRHKVGILCSLHFLSRHEYKFHVYFLQLVSQQSIYSPTEDVVVSIAAEGGVSPSSLHNQLVVVATDSTLPSHPQQTPKVRKACM